jgi:hypothetical protein
LVGRAEALAQNGTAFAQRGADGPLVRAAVLAEQVRHDEVVELVGTDGPVSRR